MIQIELQSVEETKKLMDAKSYASFIDEQE
jgi:hypothetical protein